MTYKTTRVVLVLLVVAILLGLSFALYGLLKDDSRTITVETDTSPVSFQLGDASYSIKNKELEVEVQPGSYPYRAIATVDGRKIVMQGEVDVLEEKSASLIINFQLFTEQSVKDALCNESDLACKADSSQLKVTFLENYVWAVATIDNTGLEPLKAVLKVDNGQWEVVSLGTDIDYAGSYPETVERFIKNGQY